MHLSPAPAKDLLREVVHHRSLAVRQDLHPDGVLGALHRLSSEGAARRVHHTLVEAALVDLLRGLLQLRVVERDDAHLLGDLDGGHLAPSRRVYYRHWSRGVEHLRRDAVNLHRSAVPLELDEAYPVHWGIRWHAHHEPRADVRVAELGGEDRDHLARVWRLAPLAHERPPIRGTHDLHAVHLQGELLCRRPADDPLLPADLGVHVLDLGVDPEVGQAEHGLWPERRSHELPAILEVELEECVLEDLGAASFHYICL